jgi:hypothetical protein
VRTEESLHYSMVEHLLAVRVRRGALDWAVVRSGCDSMAQTQEAATCAVLGSLEPFVIVVLSTVRLTRVVCSAWSCSTLCGRHRDRTLPAEGRDSSSSRGSELGRKTWKEEANDLQF